MQKKKKKITKRKVAAKRSIVIQSPADPSLRIAVASEMADDAMIEQEMMGAVLPYFVYQFQQDGKVITGLTVKGVNEVVRRLGRDAKSGSKIRINPSHLIKEEVEREGEKGIEVSVYAEDLVTGNSAWGVKFEPYFKTGRNGKYKNTFAVEKALSKAERNAKRKLIPEALAIKSIEKIMTKEPESVQMLEAPKTIEVVVKPVPPKASTPEELEKVALDAIASARQIDTIIKIDKGAEKSEKLSKEAKKRIHASASARIDTLGDKKV